MSILSIVIQEVHEQPGLFSVNLGVSFWTVVIFLLLLGVLVKFAFPAILGYANAREKRIQDILDAAARDRLEAEQLLEEHRRQMAEARQQAQQVVAEAKQAAERTRHDILEKTRVEQEEILARARVELEREKDKIMDTVRRDAVDLALAAASRLIGQRLNMQEDRELVREYLDQVGARMGAGAA